MGFGYSNTLKQRPARNRHKKIYFVFAQKLLEKYAI